MRDGRAGTMAGEFALGIRPRSRRSVAGKPQYHIIDQFYGVFDREGSNSAIKLFIILEKQRSIRF
jgi:hypothetical protein